MTTRTVEKQIVERTAVELPKLRRTPRFQCEDGFVSVANAGKRLRPACFGATYVIEEYPS